MFSRRNPRNRAQKLKEAFFPSMGFRRLWRYYRHRIGRLPGTAYYNAAGFATGIAVSFTPFIGFHLVVGALVAWLLRGSVVAMVIGTVVAGNPWTFPFIWFATYEIGRRMLGGAVTSMADHAPVAFTFADLMDKPLELFLPMMLGSAPFVIMSWAISFYLVRHIVQGYKKDRHNRIHKH